VRFSAPSFIPASAIGEKRKTAIVFLKIKLEQIRGSFKKYWWRVIF
jgi:hypothetical protein